MEHTKEHPMTATTMTLVEFLRARLDEDEAVARAAAEKADRLWRLNDGEGADAWVSDLDDGEPILVGTACREDRYGSDRDAAALAHAARHDPARVLAEVEAKRRIVDAHPHRDEDDLGCETCDWKPWWPGTFREPCPTIRLLALPYADHPDYRDEWRP